MRYNQCDPSSSIDSLARLRLEHSKTHELNSKVILLLHSRRGQDRLFVIFACHILAVRNFTILSEMLECVWAGKQSRTGDFAELPGNMQIVVSYRSVQ